MIATEAFHLLLPCPISHQSANSTNAAASEFGPLTASSCFDHSASLAVRAVCGLSVDTDVYNLWHWYSFSVHDIQEIDLLVIYYKLQATILFLY